MNEGFVYRDQLDVAAPSAAAWYAARWGHGDAAAWVGRMVAGEIERNGRPMRGDGPLAPGDRLAWRRPPWEEPAVPLDFDRIFDDGDLLVINKPSGLPVLPAGGFLTHTVLHQVAVAEPARPPRPVHRLGRGTSGLLVLARSAGLRGHLSKLLREHTAGATAGCEKVYRALASAVPGVAAVEAPIGRRDHPTLGHLWDVDPAGAPAYSALSVIERREDGSALLEVTIQTGRPHQIRIHLASIGCALVGDPLYGRVGSEARPGDVGYWLHAARLRLPLPDGRVLALEAPAPPVLQPTGP